MDFTWDPSFKPFLRYSYLGFLPPFSENYIVATLTTCAICVQLSRAAALLYLHKEEAFAEKVCNTSILLAQLIRAVLFLWQRKPFKKLSYDINKYIKDQKYNPIIEKEDFFLNIWKKNNAFAYAKWYFISVIIICLIWKIPILMHISKHYETVTTAYYILHTPYFAYNNYTKWMYTLGDILLDLYFLFNVIHTEMVFLSFLKFLHCQFSYMKQLLDEIYDDDEKPKDPRILRWWFENHCVVLRFAKNMNNLLEPVIAVNYIYLIVGVATCIVILVEDLSVQSLLQKFLLIALFFIIVFQLGVHCNTVEDINEVHGFLNDKMNPYIEVNDKIKTDVIFNMLNFTSRKKIIFSGWGFFTYNNKDYKDLLFSIFSFYSTLMSLK